VRFGHYKDVSFLGFAKFDGWDVIAPVAIILIVFPYLVKHAPTFLVPIGLVLLVFWLAGVTIASLRKRRVGVSEGGGSAPGKPPGR
jgi:hypothetical protein